MRVALVPLLLGLLGCSINSLTSDCRISTSNSVVAYGWHATYKPDQLVKVEGVLFLDYHDSGLVPEGYGGDAIWSTQKVSAFCFRAKDLCSSEIDEAERNYRRRYERDPLFEFAGVIKFEDSRPRNVELDYNRCDLGNVEIVAIEKLKPIVRRESRNKS